ncbi:MAG: YhcH/YjgK/YiaL family protein [Bacteroidota bacterium]|nr:YhcH/YjgK/YiaL family protein [Bacteroidota bacterium]
MILDSLKNSDAYCALHPLLKKAFDYIKSHDLSVIEPGKIVVDGDRLFISVSELNGKTPEAAKMEGHQKYIDIQIVLKGEEKMGWTAIEHCTHVLEPYNSEKDIAFFTDKPTAFIDVQPGEFVIFFPEDGHAPAIGDGPIKKAIVKVLL